MLSVFGGDEEEDRPRRRLIPLDVHRGGAARDGAGGAGRRGNEQQQQQAQPVQVGSPCHSPPHRAPTNDCLSDIELKTTADSPWIQKHALKLGIFTELLWKHCSGTWCAKTAGFVRGDCSDCIGEELRVGWALRQCIAGVPGSAGDAGGHTGGDQGADQEHPH